MPLGAVTVWSMVQLQAAGDIGGNVDVVIQCLLAWSTVTAKTPVITSIIEITYCGTNSQLIDVKLINRLENFFI